MTRDKSVYVFRFGEWDHKVGFSSSPEFRLKQCVGQGAEKVVRTWRRRNGDAPRIERIAHCILSSRQIKLQGQIERFNVSAKTACLAVDLAIHIMKDEKAELEWKLRQRTLEMEAQNAMPTQPIVLGYGADGDRDRLEAAGVPPVRVFIERMSGESEALVAACKACRVGDTLITTRPYPYIVASLTARGVTVQGILARH